MEEILAFLNQIFPLSPACIEYLGSVVQFRRVEKNELILDFGEVNRNLYFIKTGYLRCYYMVKKKVVNDWFFWNNETVVSIGSFYQQLPSEDRIVAEEGGNCILLPGTNTTTPSGPFMSSPSLPANCWRSIW